MPADTLAPPACPPEPGLAAYLADRLPRDAADAVSAHVDGCPACQARLDRLTAAADAWGLRAAASGADGIPPSDPDGPADTQVLVGTPVLAPPRLVLKPDIPGYTVDAEIGRGGMGVVYRGTHKRLNRPVAIKMVLAGGLADPRTVQRFLFEAEVLGRVDHPQVVRVFEVSMYHAPSGVAVPYIAMELLEGGTLHAHAAKGRVPAAEAAGLVEGLARAVHAAHAQGVVHRDLKPANILRESGGAFKVGDFGLAKYTAGGSAELTGTGLVVGTPQYMAPEQARGDRTVGPGADVYALGVMLYELLAGRTPFSGGEPMSLLMRVIHEPPPDVRSLAPGVPRDLAAVTMKCLAKDAHRRYASAADLADDLGRFRVGKPTRARPLAAREKAWMWARRNPAVSGLLAALAAVTLTAGASVYGSYRRAQEGERSARASEAAAESARDGAERARDDAHRSEARLEFDQGVDRCEQGRADRGLRLFIDAVERAERTGDREQGRVARVNIKDWAETLLPAGRTAAPAPRHEHLCAAYSPDGKHLVVAGRDGREGRIGRAGRVRVLDADTLAVVAELRLNRDVFLTGLLSDLLTLTRRPSADPAGWAARTAALDRLVNAFAAGDVRSVAFDPTGRRVCVGAADGSVTEWDWRTGRGTRVWEPPSLKYTDRDVLAVEYAPDGTVWFGGEDGRLRHWDPVAGRVVGDYAGGAAVTAVLVGAGGRVVYAGDRSGRVLARDARTGGVTDTWPLSGRVVDLAPRGGAPGLIALTADGQASDLRHAEPRGAGPRTAPYPGPARASGRSLAMAPDGRLLVIGDGDGNVILFDTAVGQQTTAPLRVGGAVGRIRFRPGPSREFVVQTGVGVRVQGLPRSPATPLPVPGVSPPAGPVCVLAARPGPAGPAGAGEVLVARRAAAVLGAGGGRPHKALPAAGETLCAAFHPIQDVVLRGGFGGWEAFDLGTGRATPHACPPYVGVRAIAVRPGGSGEVFVSTGGEIVVYPASDARRRVREIRLDGVLQPGEAVSGLFFPPGGGRVVVVHGARVDVLDADTGTPTRAAIEMPAPILSAALTADGARLVTGHPDATAQVWDLATGKSVIPRPLDHAGAVTSVAVRPDGAVVLTGCRDGTAQAWDVATGLPLGPKMRHEHAVTAVAWGTSANTILTGTDAGAVLAWPLETDPEPGTVDELRAKYGRLTNNSLDAPPAGPAE